MRGTPQNIICILTYADDIPASSCSIIRGSLVMEDTTDDMFVYQSDIDCLSNNSITTHYLFNIASGLLYIFSGKPETHSAGNISSHATFFVGIASNTSSQELRCHR